MHDGNRVLCRLHLYIIRYDYDICLLMFLKCIAIYESLTESKSHNDANMVDLHMMVWFGVVYWCSTAFST